MADDDSADAAVKELNGAVIDGQEVKVDRARGGGGGGRGGKYQVFVCFSRETLHLFWISITHLAQKHSLSYIAFSSLKFNLKSHR